jgi:hypothetical protein
MVGFFSRVLPQFRIKLLIKIQLYLFYWLWITFYRVFIIAGLSTAERAILSVHKQRCSIRLRESSLCFSRSHILFPYLHEMVFYLILLLLLLLKGPAADATDAPQP